MKKFRCFMQIAYSPNNALITVSCRLRGGCERLRYSPSLLHQFVIEADRAHKAPGDGAAVSLHISFLTSHRPPSDPIIHGGLPTTPIILVIPLAKMAALQGVEVVFWCPGSPAYRHQPRLRSRVCRPGRRLAAESSTPARKGESMDTAHHLRLLVKYVFNGIQDHRPDRVASRIAQGQHLG